MIEDFVSEFLRRMLPICRYALIFALVYLLLLFVARWVPPSKG